MCNADVMMSEMSVTVAEIFAHGGTDGNVPPEPRVYILHHPPESRSVCRFVIYALKPDPIVNHLVYQGVLDEILRPVKTVADRYAALSHPSLRQRGIAKRIAETTQHFSCRTYFELDRRKRPAETQAVELIEFLSDKRYSSDHNQLEN